MAAENGPTNAAQAADQLRKEVAAHRKAVDGKASETTREYVVLTRIGEGDPPDETWTIVGRPVASNDGEARKMVGSTLNADEKDNPLVAVPARYWKPKARKVKVTTSESWD